MKTYMMNVIMLTIILNPMAFLIAKTPATIIHPHARTAIA